MGHSIGFKGSVDIVTSISGSSRQLRVLAFTGPITQNSVPVIKPSASSI